MADQTFTQHRIDDDLLTLHEPNSHAFDVILQSVRRAGGGDAPLDVRISFELGWPTYDRAFEMFNLFHSAPDVRGEGPPGGLIEGKRVRVEARLDDALALEHFASADPASIAARLLDLGEQEPQHALLETEAWFALQVTQGDELFDDGPPGALREGYSTAWAAAERVSR